MHLPNDSRPVYMSLIWSWALIFIPTIVIALRIASTKHTLTDDALTTRTGITTKRTDVVELYRVKGVRSESNPFSGGKVVVTNADGSEVVVRPIADADGVVTKLRERIATARQQQGGSFREHI